MHIKFSNTNYKCPYCGTVKNDLNDKLLDRCNKNKSGYTKIKCSCGWRYGFAYDMTGNAVGFKLKNK